MIDYNGIYMLHFGTIKLEEQLEEVLMITSLSPAGESNVSFSPTFPSQTSSQGSRY